MPADVAAFGREVSDVLQRSLGATVVGVYFVGSVALGGFVPGESDIDIVALSTTGIGSDERASLAHPGHR